MATDSIPFTSSGDRIAATRGDDGVYTLEVTTMAANASIPLESGERLAVHRDDETGVCTIVVDGGGAVVPAPPDDGDFTLTASDGELSWVEAEPPA